MHNVRSRCIFEYACGLALVTSIVLMLNIGSPNTTTMLYEYQQATAVGLLFAMAAADCAEVIEESPGASTFRCRRMAGMVEVVPIDSKVRLQLLLR
jgi:hypothetical protein